MKVEVGSGLKEEQVEQIDLGAGLRLEEENNLLRLFFVASDGQETSLRLDQLLIGGAAKKVILAWARERFERIAGREEEQ